MVNPWCSNGALPCCVNICSVDTILLGPALTSWSTHYGKWDGILVGILMLVFVLIFLGAPSKHVSQQLVVASSHRHATIMAGGILSISTFTTMSQVSSEQLYYFVILVNNPVCCCPPPHAPFHW